MLSNLKRYKKDLEKLIEEGERLLFVMRLEIFPKEFEEDMKKILKNKYKEFVKKYRFSKESISYGIQKHLWY